MKEIWPICGLILCLLAVPIALQAVKEPTLDSIFEDGLISRRKWPLGSDGFFHIPFQFKGKLEKNVRLQEQVLEAMGMLQQNTCIRFELISQKEERGKEEAAADEATADFVQISFGKTCHTTVGRSKGPNPLELAAGECDTAAAIRNLLSLKIGLHAGDLPMAVAKINRIYTCRHGNSMGRGEVEEMTTLGKLRKEEEEEMREEEERIVEVDEKEEEERKKNGRRKEVEEEEELGIGKSEEFIGSKWEEYKEEEEEDIGKGAEEDGVENEEKKGGKEESGTGGEGEEDVANMDERLEGGGKSAQEEEEEGEEEGTLPPPPAYHEFAIQTEPRGNNLGKFGTKNDENDKVLNQKLSEAVEELGEEFEEEMQNTKESKEVGTVEVEEKEEEEALFGFVGPSLIPNLGEMAPLEEEEAIEWLPKKGHEAVKVNQRKHEIGENISVWREPLILACFALYVALAAAFLGRILGKWCGNGSEEEEEGQIGKGRRKSSLGRRLRHFSWDAGAFGAHQRERADEPGSRRGSQSRPQSPINTISNGDLRRISVVNFQLPSNGKEYLTVPIYEGLS